MGVLPLPVHESNAFHEAPSYASRYAVLPDVPYMQMSASTNKSYEPASMASPDFMVAVASSPDAIGLDDSGYTHPPLLAGGPVLLDGLAPVVHCQSGAFALSTGSSIRTFVAEALSHA
jgi:hypothetical protein